MISEKAITATIDHIVAFETRYNKSYVKYTREKGVPDNLIYSVLEEDKNLLYHAMVFELYFQVPLEYGIKRILNEIKGGNTSEISLSDFISINIEEFSEAVTKCHNHSMKTRELRQLSEKKSLTAKEDFEAFKLLTTSLQVKQ